MTSILTDVKHILGIAEENEAFDPDLVILINAQFSTLHQLGVGPDLGYMIVDKDNKWEEFTSGSATLNAVQSYVYLRVKLVFDPPQTGFVTAAFERQIEELTYRLNVVADYG